MRFLRDLCADFFFVFFFDTKLLVQVEQKEQKGEGECWIILFFCTSDPIHALHIAECESSRHSTKGLYLTSRLLENARPDRNRVRGRTDRLLACAQGPPTPPAPPIHHIIKKFNCWSRSLSLAAHQKCCCCSVPAVHTGQFPHKGAPLFFSPRKCRSHSATSTEAWTNCPCQSRKGLAPSY